MKKKVNKDMHATIEKDRLERLMCKFVRDNDGSIALVVLPCTRACTYSTISDDMCIPTLTSEING